MSVHKLAWLLLFILVLASSACSADVVTETSPVDQDGSTQVITSTSVPKSSTTETAITVVSSVVTTTRDTVADKTRVLGPAWADQQRWFNPQSEAAFEIYRDYILNNPNDLSTPMGALCWAQHEAERAVARYITRDGVDNVIIPLYVDLLGLTDEQVGTGEQPIEVLRELLGDDNSEIGPVGNVDDNGDRSNSSGPADISEDDITVSGESLERIKVGWKTMVEPLDDIGGEGTEWRAIFQNVVKPEVLAATRAGSGLSAPLQKFAEELFATVGEYLDGTKTDLSDPDGLTYKLINWDQFVEEAKYSQDCKRAWLVIGGVEQ